MPRSTVGLLAGLGAVMSALVGLVHGDLVLLVILAAGVATGCAGSLPWRTYKKSFRCSIESSNDRARVR
jgi:hypothetical protein